MNAEHIAAKGCAALISLLLLFATPILWAADISNAGLLSVERLSGQNSGTETGPDTNDYTGNYEMRIAVRIGFRVEHLLVSPNPQLNDIRIVRSDGTPLQQSGIAYAGIVESLPNSWARVVIDGDYIAGTINAHGTSTHFTSESSPTSTFKGFSANRTMLAPLIPPPESASDIARRTTLNALTELDQISVPVAERLTQTIGDVTQVMEIGVVIDALYQEALGGRGLSNAIATINSVDGLYRERFGLALKVNVIVLVTDDSFLAIEKPPEPDSTDPELPSTLKDHLDLFREYRINSELLPDELGLVHLFSGIQSDDEAIGLAFKGAACRIDGHDVSMSRPFLFPVLLTAHEIGHNLGADHDDTTACNAIEDNLMFSAISATTTRNFSSCSTDSINTRLEQSTCVTAEIDIDLNVTQLESNQLQINVSNLDATRAFPSATLFIDLNNTSITEAPALCELEDLTRLVCSIPATFAGDTQELAVKLRLEQDLVRTITFRLEPDGFFDLNEANNHAEVVIQGEPVPLAVTEGEITTQGGNSASGGNSNSGGGGAMSLQILLLILAARMFRITGRLSAQRIR